MRRTHKKSRRGCLECKRRHIKCDETHPSCLNCLTAERACSYPERVGVGAGQPSSGSPTTSAGDPAPTPGPSTPEKASIFLTDGSGELPVVNMLHIELFNHCTTELYMTNPTPAMNRMSKDLMLKHAFSTPYLMHQILALGARHISVVRPEQSAEYRHHAIQLQTVALSLFNAQDPATTANERIPMLIFSSLLGLHALCDTLSIRDRSFAQFFSRYISYFRLHRGVHSVIAGFWPALLETEMSPLIRMGTEAYEVEGKGHECDALMERIRQSDLPHKVVRNCEKGVNRLQYVFDEGLQGRYTAHLVISFPLFFQSEAAELIEKGDPIILALLAYYAVALHYCRDIWVIGDAGKYVFEMFASQLGPEYDSLLEWPRNALEETPFGEVDLMDTVDPELTNT